MKITRLIVAGAVSVLVAGCASGGSKRTYEWIGCAVIGGIAGHGIDKAGDEDGATGAALGATLGALLCGLTQQESRIAMDTDGDGVADALDSCADTPGGAAVDTQGCPQDSDGDGIADFADRCVSTPSGTRVDATGCPLDADGDGVADASDACPGTAAGVAVDARGCPRDADGDGVADAADACPGTPSGVAVDARGCPRDSDSDGVADAADACPGTRAGAQVDTRGCEPPPAKTLVLKGVQFLSNSDELTLPSLSVLAEVVESLQDNPDVKVEIGGHTDDRGAARYNLELSQRRAQAVRQFLINRGIDAARLRARGYGETQPIADNATAEGRERNRRVELRRID